MNIKYCLFIADESVEEITDKVTGSLKKEGITLHFSHVDLRDERFYVEDAADSTKLVLSFDKLKAEIKDKYINISFDIVACDFNYAKDPLDGFKVIKWLKNESESQKKRIRRANFLLYSSEQEKLIEKTNSVDELRKLIRLKIEDFVDRKSLAEVIIKVLSAEKKDVTSIIISELEKFESLEFKSVYPPFQGKTLGEIAIEIEKQSHHGLRFQHAIIEYTIAHLIELNN